MPGMHNVRLDTSLEMLLERSPAAQVSRVLATVVATAGSTYRKPGARMVIMADGSYLGLLSGGCLEADLKLHAQDVLDSGIPRAIEYDMRGPDDILFGIGAGCEGAMRVLLEPAGPGSPAAAALAAAGRATRAGRPSSLVSVHESADFPLGTYDARAIAALRAVPRRRAIPRRRHIARHGLGRRRPADAGICTIPRNAPACIDLRGGPRCAAGGERRARPGLASVGRRPSSRLRGGGEFPRRRSEAVRSALVAAPSSPSSAAMPPW